MVLAFRVTRLPALSRKTIFSFALTGLPPPRAFMTFLDTAFFFGESLRVALSFRPSFFLAGYSLTACF